MRFYSLKIASIRSDTSEAIQIGFKIPEDHKEAFRFDPGQYLTLKVEIEGKLLRRAYSICSAIQEETISVLVKRLKGGKVSNFLHDTLRIGDQLEVMPPGGHFKLSVDKDQQAVYYFFGAGSGITPLISMIQSILEGEPSSKCYLLYGNRDKDTIIFRDKLARLSLVYQDRLFVEHVLSQPKAKQKYGTIFSSPRPNWKGKTGRINQLLIQSFLQINKGENPKGYYICRPGLMIESTVQILGDLGIDKSMIHREYFTSTDLSFKVEESISTQTIKERPSKVIVSLDGMEHKVLIHDNTNIVQALINNGIEPPYACLSGTCSTCMAKVTKGEVKMDISIGLEDEEKENGFILSCQSHPLTELLALSYDID